MGGSIGSALLFDSLLTGDWIGSDTSTDGQVICVCHYYSQNVFISTDGGATWTAKRPAGNTYLQRWRGCSVSADGSVIFVCCATGSGGVGGVYRSIDTGATWSDVSPVGSVIYKQVACSKTDGSKVIVTVYGGHVYTSINTGTNWTERNPTGSTSHSYWQGCAISDDGAFSIVGGEHTRVWYSSDTFATWNETQPNGNTDRHWWYVDCDSDASHIIIGQSLDGGDGRLYITTDSMANWSEVQPAGAVNKYWMDVDISNDGSVMMAGNTTRLFLSVNSGANWSEEQPAGNVDKGWYGLCCSGDNSILYASIYTPPGYVYKKVSGSWSDINPFVQWTDYTTPANNATANDFKLLVFPPGTTDAFYIGIPSISGSSIIYTINIGTAGAGTWTITWEYWDGDSWETIPVGNVVQKDNQFLDFKTAGTGIFEITIPVGMASSTVNGITEYWIRGRVSAYTSITVQPLGTQLWYKLTGGTSYLYPTESLSLSESIVKTITKVVQETVLLTQNIIKNITISLADILNITTSVSTNIEKPIISDYIPFSDSVIKNIEKPVNETLLLTQGIVKNITISFFDLLHLTDYIYKGTSKDIYAHDYLHLSDSVVKQITLSKLEHLILGDVLAKNISLYPYISLYMTDTLVKSFNKALIDPFIITDSITKQIVLSKLEYLILGDVLAKNISLYPYISLYLTDTLVKSFNKALSDPFTITDSITKQITKTPEEILPLVDEIARRMSMNFTFAELLNLSESVIKNYNKQLETDFNISESLVKRMYKYISSKLHLGDSVMKDMTKYITEILPLDDTPVIHHIIGPPELRERKAPIVKPEEPEEWHDITSIERRKP